MIVCNHRDAAYRLEGRGGMGIDGDLLDRRGAVFTIEFFMKEEISGTKKI